MARSEKIAMIAKTTTRTPEVTIVVRVCSLRGGSLNDRCDCIESNSSFHSNRLRQVARLIDIATPTHTDVISQQLQRNYGENW